MLPCFFWTGNRFGLRSSLLHVPMLSFAPIPQRPIARAADGSVVHRKKLCAVCALHPAVSLPQDSDSAQVCWLFCSHGLIFLFDSTL
jgi:hypothetical protein